MQLGEAGNQRLEQNGSAQTSSISATAPPAKPSAPNMVKNVLT
jgi:hypothetical protein